ncbi:hypothetical protein D1K39_19150 [Salmonella enterica]|nr:hypothetical protein [Salmonella enterica]
MIQITIQRMMRTDFMQVGRHIIWPNAVAVMTGFLHRIGAKTHHFTLNQHVQTIAIRQRLRSFYIEIILRHIQHLAYRQANKFW